MNKILNKKINEKDKSLSYDKDIFRILADESPNMIFINKRGRLVYVNKLCTDVMEYSEKEVKDSVNFLIEQGFLESLENEIRIKQS